MSPISRLEEDIKNLKVQGATNVALLVLDGLNLANEILKTQKNADPYVFLLERLIRLLDLLSLWLKMPSDLYFIKNNPHPKSTFS